MRLTHWLARLARTHNLARRSIRRKRYGDVRPAVERLEDRTLLAVAFGDQAIISTAANGAYAVHAADLDGDGDMDVLSASQVDDSIRWYRNDGDGSFSSPMVLNASAVSARDVQSADLDGDGDIDVLAASVGDNTVGWYRNDGNGGFSSELVISDTASGAYAVFPADLDGDGDIDVLAALVNGNSITWYANDGDGNFSAQGAVATGVSNARDVHVADLDGDGDLDVLSASVGNDTIAWYENDGNQSFSAHTLNASADGAHSVHAGDLDGDGDIDVLAASAFDDTVAWYRNLGSGNFSGELLISDAEDNVNSAHAVDIDGDGDLDVVSISENDDTVTWFLNDGAGSFTAQSDLTTTADGGNHVFAADLDNDGDQDILSASLNDNKIAWYENLGLDFGDAPSPYPVTRAENGAEHVATGPTLGAVRDTEADGTHSASADADGSDEDGVVDTGGTIRVGQLDAGVTVSVQNAPSGAKLDAWMDFNGDGSWGGPFEHIADSVAVVNGDNTISFDVPSWAVEGTTFGRFRLSTAGGLGVGGAADDGEVEDYEVAVEAPVAASGLFGSTQVFDTEAASWSVYAADVDSDGDMDLIADNGVTWYENDGDETFTSHLISDGIDSGELDVVGVDFDGDGDVDIVSANANTDSVVWHENDGFQSFTTQSIANGLDSVRKIHVSDLDLDGDLDVLSASYFGDKLAWHENDGLQNFTTHTISVVEDGAISISSADLDRDGDVDVIGAGYFSDTLSWYENDGSQNFSLHVISSSIDGPEHALAADLDDDGNLDIVAVSRTANASVVWYQNMGAGAFSAARVISATIDTPQRLSASDIDGDGDIDVVTASHGDNTVSWHENDGTGNFATHIISATASGSRGIFTADVDQDGDIDVLAAVSGIDQVAWYENNATPTFDALLDLTIAEDAPEQTVDLAGIGAGGEESQSLRVTASSSDTGLVPDPTVTYTSANSTGSLAFTPVLDQNGTATITVTVEDGGLDGDLDTAGDNATFSRTFDVTVDAVDDPPVLSSLPDLNIEEGDRIHNDDGTDFDNFVSDVDSDTTTIEFRIVNFGEVDSDFDVSIDMDNDSGSFADRSNNTFHAHPEDDFNGSTIVTIEARDAQGNVSAQQSFTLAVTAVNDVPVAVADNYSTNEDEQLVVVATGVLANDSDIEDDPLTAVLVADVSDGTLSLASDGGFTYTPDAGFYGTDSFTYKANDGSDDGNTVAVSIDVVQHPEIRGTLVHDLDGSGVVDVGEPGLAGWTVFLDTSDDGILDVGEASTITLADERGSYSFADLTPGDYTVAWITPALWQATASSQSVTVVAGDVREDVDLFDQFIVSATPTISTAPFADDGSADTITIGPNGTNVEVTVNGNVWVRQPANGLTSITVDGSGDDDTLIVDLGGLDASVGFAADLTFNGNGDGSDNDTLQIQNGSAANIAYSFANAADGTITIDGSSIEFTGLEPILDNLASDHREFTFGTTDDMVTLSDDGTSDNGLMTLSSVSSSETVTFANPGTSLGIHLGSGADQLTVLSLDDGFAGALTLNGEGGDDTIDASAINVAVKQNGSGGNDTLRGGSANDTLNGGSGSDLLAGGAGNDKLQGQGTSYDTLSGGLGDDTLDGGDGYDRISESADVDFTATDSSLTGLGTDTLINIQLVQLFGGSSANTIDASAFSGRAFVNGSGGHDTLTGGGWYDRIFGGSGRDLITGGVSVIDPGTGLPTYDVLRGQGGNYDTLIGGDGADKLNGGAGHDNLVGGGGNDVLTGESGNDTLDGGAGIDRLYERSNVDMTLTDASLSGGMGSDTLASIETAYLKGGSSNNRLDASAFSGDVTLIGVGGDDTLQGGSGNDMLNGRSGADSITGGDGNDTLKGLRDNDTLNGGAGNDWIDGGTQDDAISGWTGDDVLYGRSGNDILVGGQGHDSLYGASGDDILQGDDGKTDTDHARDDDRLDGGTDGDTVRGGGGSDTIMDDASEVDENFAYWADWVDAV